MSKVVPACLRHGLGILSWGPLGGGFLSGKYRRGEQPPKGSRIASARESSEEPGSAAPRIRIADPPDRGRHRGGDRQAYAQIALNWLLRRRGVVAVTIGARTLPQLDDNLGAVGWELTADQVRRLDQVSDPPSFYAFR